MKGRGGEHISKWTKKRREKGDAQISSVSSTLCAMRERPSKIGVQNGLENKRRQAPPILVGRNNEIRKLKELFLNAIALILRASRKVIG